MDECLSRTDPRGHRYATPDRERAHLAWKVAARRSFTRAADLTGIAVDTLRAWHKEQDWAARVAAEDREAVEMARVALAAGIVDETERSPATLIELRDGANDEKVRLDAAVYLLGVAGIAPTARTETAILTQPAPVQAARPPHDLRSLSDEELRALEEGTEDTAIA